VPFDGAVQAVAVSALASVGVPSSANWIGKTEKLRTRRPDYTVTTRRGVR
jgi:hypothetical protein